eukprot:3920178-Rhodomonas_salina.1
MAFEQTMTILAPSSPSPHSAAAHFAILSGIFDTQGKENHNNVQDAHCRWTRVCRTIREMRHAECEILGNITCRSR